MPISYTIDESRCRIYSRAEGVVTYGDLHDHINSDLGAAAASYSELFDATGATINLSAQEIRRLAAERRALAQHLPPAPSAVVAPTDLFFGIFRIFDIMTETIRPLRVFRDRQEAEVWLDSLSD